MRDTARGPIRPIFLLLILLATAGPARAEVLSSFLVDNYTSTFGMASGLSFSISYQGLGRSVLSQFALTPDDVGQTFRLASYGEDLDLPCFFTFATNAWDENLVYLYNFTGGDQETHAVAESALWGGLTGGSGLDLKGWAPRSVSLTVTRLELTVTYIYPIYFLTFVDFGGVVTIEGDKTPPVRPDCPVSVQPARLEAGEVETWPGFGVVTSEEKGCAWNSLAWPQWARPASPGYGCGPGALYVRIEGNAGDSPREGVLNISGFPVEIYQVGSYPWQMFVPPISPLAPPP